MSRKKTIAAIVLGFGIGCCGTDASNDGESSDEAAIRTKNARFDDIVTALGGVDALRSIETEDVSAHGERWESGSGSSPDAGPIIVGTYDSRERRNLLTGDMRRDIGLLHNHPYAR